MGLRRGGSREDQPMHVGIDALSRPVSCPSSSSAELPHLDASGSGWRPEAGPAAFSQAGGCGLTDRTFSVHCHGCHPSEFKAKTS